MTDLFSIQGKTIVVTGGTRGIGRAISLHLARYGARVLANYVRDEEAAEKLRQAARDEGLPLEVLRADVTMPKGIEALAERTAASFAPLSAFVHCAATGVHRPAEELERRHLEWTFKLNVFAFLDLTKALLPHFDGEASLVALSSEGASRAVPYYTAVGASKGALESMVRHLAVELAPKGLRVNALAPGSVPTESWDAFPDRERRIREWRDRSPLGRLTEADEVAAAAHFLCCAASRGINGHILVVDGGKSVRE